MAPWGAILSHHCPLLFCFSFLIGKPWIFGDVLFSISFSLKQSVWTGKISDLTIISAECYPRKRLDLDKLVTWNKNIFVYVVIYIIYLLKTRYLSEEGEGRVVEKITQIQSFLPPFYISSKTALDLPIFPTAEITKILYLKWIKYITEYTYKISTVDL